MRKLFLVGILCAMALSVMAQKSNPKWVQDLASRNADIIDSIVACDPDKDEPQYDSYLIYYHQPLSHANPQGTQFPMRALREAEEVVAQADSMRAAGQMYADSVRLAQSYTTLR